MRGLNYIGGKWVEAASGGSFSNINPADGEEIGKFPDSGAEDAGRAARAAEKSFYSWSRTPVPERGKILRGFAGLLSKQKEEIARIETMEMGKVMAESRGDVQEGIDTALYAAGEGVRFFGRTVPSELPDKACFTFRKPAGVAALITPWNFPAAIPCWKLMPALLGGNTVVLKPSREAPWTAEKLVELLADAGVPEGVVNLVQGPGSTAGKELCENPAVSVVSFTGSAAAGSEIGAAAGGRLKKVSLELGGKNGQIVMDDAELELALEGALWGAFGTTGQRCTATSRLILHEAVHDEFLARLVASAGKLKIGSGLDEDADMGPLVSGAQREKVHGYVESGIEEGASLECGGGFYAEGPCGRGFFYKPTVFSGAAPGMKIASEEIFGPVLSVLKAGSLEEALEIMNAVEYGLSSSIYTRDVNSAMRAAREIEAGVVYINSPTIGAECHLPFGGVKKSGNGHAEGGWAAYDTFTREATVYLDYSGRLQKAQIDD